MLFPISLIFDEIVLSVSSGTLGNGGILYKLLFTLAFGFAGSLIAVLFGRRRFIAEVVLSELCALFFTIEAVLFNNFRIYFSPANLISGAGDVAAHYGSELIAGAASGTLLFLLFSLPSLALVLWFFHCRKIGKTCPLLWAAGAYAGMDHCPVCSSDKVGADDSADAASEKSAAKQPSSAKKTFSADKCASLCGFLALSLTLHSLVSTAVKTGPFASVYGSQYSFHSAVESFGLMEASSLSVILGDPETREASFEAEGGFGSGDTDPDDIADDEAALASSSNAEEDTASANGEAAKPKLATPNNTMRFIFPSEGSGKSADTLTGYLKTLRPTKKNDYTGIFAGKNLIMICAESYCDTFIRPELTPTLWRLTHNGFYFPNFYQPSWGGSTTTGELSLILGLDGSDGDESFSGIANNNHFFSMGRQLQRQNYFSLSFHNGHYTYYDRNTTHQNIGYDAFFATGRNLETFCGHGYPTDSEMIRGTLPLYIDRSPFSVYYMTVSGHAPYKKDSPYVKWYYDKVDSVLGDEYYEKTKYYICYQMELEKALTDLVDGLEAAGIADDTVIVMTGDHYPYGLGGGRAWGNDRDYIDDLIKDDDVLSWNQDQSGCIIWSGCLEHELKDMACEISAPCHSLDILPTVSNLFGVEFDSRLLPGRDVFSEAEPLAFWNNLSWVTKEGKYSSRKREFYPEETCTLSKEEQDAYVEAVNKTVANKILMNRSIMHSDYYSLLFEKEDFGDNAKKQSEIYEMLKTEKEARDAELKAAEEAKKAEEEAIKAEEAEKAAEESSGGAETPAAAAPTKK